MSKLITPSLISSVEWLQNCPASWKQKAFEDLRNQLARDYSKPMPDYVKFGIDFENTVYNTCVKYRTGYYKNAELNDIKCSTKFKELLAICMTGEFQRKTKSIISLASTDYCLYGKIDVWFPEMIIDIKTTLGDKIDKGKYLNSAQHLIYCYNENISNFTYLICQFGEDKKLINFEEILYTMTSREEVKEELIKKINKTIGFLQIDSELWDLYNNKFNMF